MFKPVEIQVTEKQQAIPQQLSQSRSESYRLVERAQLIVQLIASGNPSNLKVQRVYESMQELLNWLKKAHG